MYAHNYSPTRTPLQDLGMLRRRRPLRPSARRARKLVLGLGTFLFMAIVLAQSAHGSAPAGYEVVRVQPGQSLWSIAAGRYPAADTRSKVEEIIRANGLKSPQVNAGAELRIPSS